MKTLLTLLFLPLLLAAQGINMTNIHGATNVSPWLDGVLGLSDTNHTRMLSAPQLSVLAVGKNYRTASQFGALGGTNHDEVALQNGINWSATNGGVIVFDKNVTVGTNNVGTINAVSGTYQYFDLATPSGTTILVLPGVTITRDTNNLALFGNTTPQSIPYYTVPPESNITVLGGIWNCNGLSNTIYEFDATNNFGAVGFYFMGVSNLVTRGVTIQNSAYFAFLLANAVDCRLNDYTAEQHYVADWSTYHETGGNDGLHLWDPIENLQVNNMNTWNLNDNPIGICPSERIQNTNLVSGFTIKPWGLTRLNGPGNYKGMQHVRVNGLHIHNSLQSIGFYGYPEFGNTALVDFVIDGMDGFVYSGGVLGGGSPGITGIAPGGGCYYHSLTIKNYAVTGGGASIHLCDDVAQAGNILLDNIQYHQVPYDLLPSKFLEVCSSNVVINGLSITATNEYAYAITSRWTNVVGGAVRTTANLTVNGAVMNGIDYLIGDSAGIANLSVNGLTGAKLMTNSTATTVSATGTTETDLAGIVNVTLDNTAVNGIHTHNADVDYVQPNPWLTYNADLTGNASGVKEGYGGNPDWNWVFYSNHRLGFSSAGFTVTPPVAVELDGVLTANNGLQVGTNVGISQTNVFEATGTNWTIKVVGGLVTGISHTP